MTFKNNRAPLLSNIKLYASFHHHMWIQTGVTVQKLLSWVVTSVTLTFHLWPWPFAWILPWSLVIIPENFMMIRSWEHSQKDVTDGPTDWTTHRAAWSQLKILQHLIGANKLTHWPYEAIWWHKSGSTLAQVTACCQYWFIIHGSFVAFTWERFHKKCLWD